MLLQVAPAAPCKASLQINLSQKELTCAVFSKYKTHPNFLVSGLMKVRESSHPCALPCSFGGQFRVRLHGWKEVPSGCVRGNAKQEAEEKGVFRLNGKCLDHSSTKTDGAQVPTHRHGCTEQDSLAFWNHGNHEALSLSVAGTCCIFVP